MLCVRYAYTVSALIMLNYSHDFWQFSGYDSLYRYRTIATQQLLISVGKKSNFLSKFLSVYTLVSTNDLQAAEKTSSSPK